VLFNTLRPVRKSWQVQISAELAVLKAPKSWKFRLFGLVVPELVGKLFTERELGRGKDPY